MIAKNELEKMVVKMIEEGKPLHGMARDIAIDMMLREDAEEEEKNEK